MEFYCRNIIECLRVLWGDPDFVEDLIFEPEHHYSDDDEVMHLFHEMETGKWWWRVQVCPNLCIVGSLIDFDIVEGGGD